MKIPRIMLAAPGSGSGKTLITCGILKALVNRGMKAASFKCGPDYIDPMFHQRVIGTPAKNLDTFFTGSKVTNYLFGREAKKADISVLEGVMGYYDGAGGITTAASSYELAKVTDTPVVLVVNAKGMSLSVIPVIRGFLEYREDSRIVGVILNQVTKSTCELLKPRIESELPVRVLGYVPKSPELALESRHLGLMMPEEIADLGQKLERLAALLEETLDLEQFISCAMEAPELEWERPDLEWKAERPEWDGPDQKRKAEKPEWETSSPPAGVSRGQLSQEPPIRIGLASDEAFCFYYQDNLELLEELGAELVRFSPIYDRVLPKNLDGLLLYGGYPELYARKLSENESMRRDIRRKLEGGMPYLAECGGFMYLQEQMEDMEHRSWPMAGVIKGTVHNTGKLGRFGYLELSPLGENQLLKEGETIKAHEFHYFESSSAGTAYHGKKPYGTREWNCIHGGTGYAAGFPHLYYYSNPRFARRFLEKCLERRR